MSKLLNFSDGLTSLTNSYANNRNAIATNKITSLKLDDAELRAIYKSGMGEKIVDIKASSIFKEGIICANESDKKYIEDKILPEIKQAAKFMIGFGRGIVIVAEPNRSLKEPLSQNVNLQTTRFISVSGLNVNALIDSNQSLVDEMFEKPFFYIYKSEFIHHSRVIDLTYKKPLEDERSFYKFGGMSEFEYIYPQLINDAVIERAVPTLIEKISTLFYKVSGFKDALRQKKESNILRFFRSLENFRGIYGAGVIDAQDDLKTENQNLSGISEADIISLRRLAAVTRIPLSWLVGEAVQGLNATGKNESDIFWAVIKALGDEYILTKLNDMLFTLGLEKIEIKEQAQMSPLERAQFETIVIDNAAKIGDIGFDAKSYMVQKGLEVEVKSDFENEFDL